MPFNSNTISVLLSNGNGSFQAQQTYAVGSGPWTLLSPDLNGDGATDLIVVNKSGNNVGVLLGNTGFTTFVGQTYTIDQPAKLGMTTQPTATAAGQVIDPSTGVQVSVQDSGGGTVSIDSSTVTLTLSSGVFANTGTSTIAAAAVNGVATFTGLIVNTPGSYTLSGQFKWDRNL